MPPNSNYPDAPHGRDTLGQGKKFEEYVRKILNPHGITIWNWSDQGLQIGGENGQGVEIKYDSRMLDTLRLSIEVAEKSRRSNADWIASGIFKPDNSWGYAQGCYERVYLFSKRWLVRWYRGTNAPVSEFNGTIRRFYLPMSAANMGAIMVLDDQGRRIDSTLCN